MTAPSQEVEAAVITAAAEYFLDRSESDAENPRVDRVINRSFLTAGSDTIPELLPAGVAEAIAARHGLRAGTLEDHLRCDRDAFPPVCFLDGAEAVVTFGRPDLEGASGTINVSQYRRASAGPAPPRAYSSGAVLRVTRVDGTWQVTGVEMIIVSD